MISFIKKLWRDRRGNVLVMVGAAMPVVVGAAGLGVDTIQWTLWKRQLQREADSAALAGVYAKIQSQNLDSAITTDLAKNKHATITILSGYPQTTQPTHATGLWLNGVKVTLAMQKRLGFSSYFMSSPPIIKAEATAATVKTGVYCVVSLESSSATGIINSGNGTIDLGCGMITNSTSLDAAIASGSSTVIATPIAAVGDVRDSNNWGSAELLPFTVKQPDPFADINPDVSGCTASPAAFNDNSPGGPGCYSAMSINRTVTLTPGTYVIDGGNLNFGTNANVTCNGCTFILTNKSTSSTADIGKMTINGSAQLTMTAPSSGTYNGILVYQDRRAPGGNGNVNQFDGNTASRISGALYFPNQEVQIGGNSLITMGCGQFVARKVTFTGSGGIDNNCTTTPPNSEDFMGQHVKLVA